MLTDIVVGATVTALLLALALQLHKRRGTLDPEALRPLQPGRWRRVSCRRLPVAGAAARSPACCWSFGHAAAAARVPDVHRAS